MSERRHNMIEVENHYGDGKQWRRGPVTGSSRSGLIFMASLKRDKSRPTIADRLRPVMAVKSAGKSNVLALEDEKMILDDLKECEYIRRIFGDEKTSDETSKETYYNILLEYPSGGTLKDLIDRSGRTGLQENEVWHYTRCLLLGLHHLHDHGYVHRNLKPENIILVHHRVGCIAKIGEYESVIDYETLKKRLWNPYTRFDIEYLSPEAFGNMQQGPGSDIWALGCIVYEMLTGKCVWDDQNKGYEEIKKDLYQMKIGKGFMKLLDDWISDNAKKFLTACFEIKTENRWTAERLLALPFVEFIS